MKTFYRRGRRDIDAIDVNNTKTGEYVYKIHKNSAGTYAGCATEWCASKWWVCHDQPHYIAYGVIRQHDLGLIEASSRDDALSQAQDRARCLFNNDLLDCSVLLVQAANA